MELETERLLLRRWKKEDYLPFYKMNSDPEVMELLLKVLTREESDALIDKLETYFDEHNYGYWALEEKSSGKLIGFTGLMPSPLDPSSIQISWRLMKEYWGKGYATEAARATIDFGLNQLKLSEIVSLTVPHNLRSRAVMERIGMTRNASDDFGHPLVPDGHPLKRHVLYRISKSLSA
jgi:RimJ/RimL family protein N-acetyltransferase